jgi:hypothetical protein
MKAKIDFDEIVNKIENKIMDNIKKSLESKTFEIGEFTNDLIQDYPENAISFNHVGKKVISKIMEIIENDMEDMR